VDSNRSHVAFHCRHCGRHTTSEALATEPYFDNQDHIRYRYRLVRCAACLDISLLLGMEIGELDGRELWDEASVYPKPPRRLGSAVPRSIQSCFDEVEAAFEARAFTASAIMCRRALELLASERGVRERNLARAIDALKTQGDIDQRLYDWCTTLRLAGNQAAHDVGPGVSQLDATDMRDLVEAVIDYVFVFQGRYENFKKRKKRRAADRGANPSG
jgi:hypothetical protein